MKRTPWFPVSVKPVRVGWYEARYWPMRKVLLMYWDGRGWDGFLVWERDTWRGLTEPAK